MVLPAEQQRRQRLLIPALHFVCGFSNGLPDVAKRMMFVNTLQIEPAVQAALFGVLLSVPWQLNLGMAFLTDSVPIGGRRRIPYLLVCLSVQAVVNLCIGLLVGPDLSVGVLAGLLFASTVAQVMTICANDDGAGGSHFADAREPRGPAQTPLPPEVPNACCL